MNEMYRVAISSILLVWKLLARENKTLLQWEIEMDLFSQGRSQRKIIPRKKKNNKRMLDRPLTKYLYFNKVFKTVSFKRYWFYLLHKHLLLKSHY